MTKSTETVKGTAVTFEIKGKKHDLKLNWESIKILHAISEGGAFGLVGKSLMGDDATYANVVYAGLLYTGEKYTLADVNDAIEESFQKGSIGMGSVIETLHSVVLDNPYYKEMVEKMLEQDPNAKEAIAKIRGL